jgi:hypothetical protein
MLKTTAIVHAPGVENFPLRVMVKKFQRFVERMNFYQPDIRINNYPEINADLPGIYRNPPNLIIGWGLVEKPDWSGLEYAIKTSTAVRIFIAIDLYETIGEHGRVLLGPNLKHGRFWQRKAWQLKCKQFLNGSYVSCCVPYGLRRIPSTNLYDQHYSLSCLYTLVPGSTHEIKIVRLLFDLYANHGYTLTDLANLLNAQGVRSPHKGKVWNPRKIKTIITSPVYIGSNQFSACMKHNVFPALIDRSIFYAAQTRMYGNQRHVSAIG